MQAEEEKRRDDVARDNLRRAVQQSSTIVIEPAGSEPLYQENPELTKFLESKRGIAIKKAIEDQLALAGGQIEYVKKDKEYTKLRSDRKKIDYLVALVRKNQGEFFNKTYLSLLRELPRVPNNIIKQNFIGLVNAYFDVDDKLPRMDYSDSIRGAMISLIV